jgi:predicted component of type VI protein secretion system
MAKLQLFKNGMVIDEFPLTARTTIGRRSRCDVFLDHPGVSGMHAVLERVGDNYFIQDQDSTNGTLLNGRKVGHMKLHDGDEIIVARKFKLRFILRESLEIAQTVILPIDDPVTEAPPALIRILDGSHAGRELQLDREQTTLGKSGKLVLVIARQANGYFMSQQEGPGELEINGIMIRQWPHRLRNGDRLKVLGTAMQFEYRS